MKRYLIILTVLISAGILTAKKSETVITKWLVTEPLPLYYPVFSDSGITAAALLEFEQVDITTLSPAEGHRGKGSLNWQEETTAASGYLNFAPAATGKSALVYTAFYIETKRWTKANLIISSHHVFQTYLDGKLVTSKAKADRPPESTATAVPDSVSAELILENGKHLVIIKSVYDPACSLPWNVGAQLHYPQYDQNHLSVSIEQQAPLSIQRLLDSPEAQRVSISGDGKYIAAVLRQRDHMADAFRYWLEIRRFKDGKLVHTFSGGMAVKNIQWSPMADIFTYTDTQEKKTTLWAVNISSGATSELLAGISGFKSYRWSPQGDFLIYSITEKAEENKTGLKRLRGMPDRQPDNRDRSYLYHLSYPGLVRSRITSGPASTDVEDISRDGKKLIFNRSFPDFQNRPYHRTELFVMDLRTMSSDSVWGGYWFNSARWSPDGKQLLLNGGPSMFGQTGRSISSAKYPLESDRQVYLYTLSTKAVEAISKNFNPSIVDAHWRDDHIFFQVQEGSKRLLYRYDTSSRKYMRLKTGLNYISRFAAAGKADAMVCLGSGSVQIPRIIGINTESLKSHTIHTPASAYFRDLKLGRVEPWNFTNTRGEKIQGRIYYPPDFDPGSKYPCIVYYYGGVSPVSQNFGGRYPKNYYAANGYVVYVLQPGGAVGYGQDFSARHVNDWGTTVADEIVDGVQKFLNAHSFVDPGKVGCIGASYGGFMTMLLTTRTDIFGAAVSHAGISSISSYWGEGFWGYWYNSVSAANSFPWNRKDIYIDQSPLFSADMIKTPLLLLHGDADTNVPPGESRQLYTALKLLDKPVELIEVADQNHWVLDYKKRIRWTKSIIAWFDRWLKEDPAWWDNLYPDNSTN